MNIQKNYKNKCDKIYDTDKQNLNYFREKYGIEKINNFTLCDFDKYLKEIIDDETLPNINCMKNKTDTSEISNDEIKTLIKILLTKDLTTLKQIYNERYSKFYLKSFPGRIGWIEGLQFLNNNNNPWNYNTDIIDSITGGVEIIKYMYENNCSVEHNFLLIEAIQNNNPQLLQYFKDINIKPSNFTIEASKKYGNDIHNSLMLFV